MDNEGKYIFAIVQMRWALIFLFDSLIIILILLFVFNLISLKILFSIFILLSILLAFFLLKRVQCTENKIEIITGLIFKKSILFDDIISSQLCSVPWYFGYGIKLINDSMFDTSLKKNAIKIRTRDGKNYVLKIKGVENLNEIINNKILR